MDIAVLEHTDLTGMPDGQGRGICMSWVTQQLSTSVLKLVQYPGADRRHGTGTRINNHTGTALCAGSSSTNKISSLLPAYCTEERSYAEGGGCDSTTRHVQCAEISDAQRPCLSGRNGMDPARLPRIAGSKILGGAMQ